MCEKTRICNIKKQREYNIITYTFKGNGNIFQTDYKELIVIMSKFGS